MEMMEIILLAAGGIIFILSFFIPDKKGMERITNEKIMAVNEYSDTVLTEIRKNHEEAVFLYDMLNNKHTSLKNTVAEVNTVVREAEEAKHSLEQRIPEAVGTVDRGGEEAAAWSQAEAEVAVTEQENGEIAAVPEEWPTDGEQDYNSNEKILRLYRQGKSAVMIAKELELGICEVRLVIDLFQESRK